MTTEEIAQLFKFLDSHNASLSFVENYNINQQRKREENKIPLRKFLKDEKSRDIINYAFNWADSKCPKSENGSNFWCDLHATWYHRYNEDTNVVADTDDPFN